MSKQKKRNSHGGQGASYGQLYGAFVRLQGMHSELSDKFREAVALIEQQQKVINQQNEIIAQLGKERDAAVATTTMNMMQQAWSDTASESIMQQLSETRLKAEGAQLEQLGKYHEVLTGGVDA